MRALRQLIGHQYPKNMDEIIRESIKLKFPLQHFATVIISEGDIIKGINQSKPNNLILDHFGEWLAALIRQPQNNVKILYFTNTDGGAADINIWCSAAGSESVFTRKNSAGALNLGTKMEVGSGVTAATRADIQIETNLGTAPEDDSFDTGAGSYTAGVISVAGAITAGGAGTINETLFIAVWVDDTHSAQEVALLHDILISGEAFVLGNTITVAYTINL